LGGRPTSHGHTLNITAYQRTDGNVFVELQKRDTTLRAFHTHDGHINPAPLKNHVNNTHMHFPTEKHPIQLGCSSYAYPVNGACSDADYALSFFCGLLNITVDVLQPYLFVMGSNNDTRM